ncbi:MAG: hypothetical protein AB7O50_16150 [Pseudolabrys sp.]
MTTLIATLTHVPAPLSNAAERIARGFKIFFESLGEAQSQVLAARKRYPFVSW